MKLCLFAKNFLYYCADIYSIFIYWFIKPILLRESKFPRFKKINERAIEYGFIFKHLWQICPAEVLDVGTGTSALPHLIANCGFKVTAIDKMQGSWKGNFVNRHYYIKKNDIAHSTIKQKFDFITCISVLEHITNHESAISGMFNLLKNKGYLLLTFPYNEKQYIENVYKLPGVGYGENSPYICKIYSRKEITEWLIKNGGQIVEQEYYEIFTGDFWTFGKYIYPPRKVDRNNKHHLTCLLIQKL